MPVKADSLRRSCCIVGNDQRSVPCTGCSWSEGHIYVTGLSSPARGRREQLLPCTTKSPVTEMELTVSSAGPSSVSVILCERLLPPTEVEGNVRLVGEVWGAGNAMISVTAFDAEPPKFESPP